MRDKLEALLYQMRKNPAYGVECVYNKEEVEKEQHLTGDFEYVLEGMQEQALELPAPGKF